MDRENVVSNALSEASTPGTLCTRGWSRPEFEVICLSCEITAYAPDDEPLF